MSYPINVNIPNAPNNPADDQPLMKANFGNINNFLSVDHVAPGTANNGTHSQVNLFNKSTPPKIGDITLYAKNNNGYPTLWINNNPPGQDVALWNGLSTFTIGSQARTSTIGGIVIQFGVGTTNSSGSGSISFTPNFSNFLSATLTRVESGGNNRGFIQFTATPSNSGGNVMMRDSGGTGIAGTFYWIAMGN